MVDVAKLSYSVDTSQLKAGEAALGQMAAAHNKAGASAKKMAADVTQSGQATELARHHALNMQYQLNDMAVGFASGQSPFTILMQQGMQMQQIFAQTGQTSIRGAFGAIGQTFMSMLNPITLAIVGVSALAGGLSYLFGLATAEGKEAETVLKEHEQTIKDIKTAYGDAVEGVEAYIAKSKELVNYNAGRKLKSEYELLNEEIEKYAKRVDEIVSGPARFARNVLGEFEGGGISAGLEERARLVLEIVAAMRRLEARTIGVIEFQKELTRIGTEGDENVRRIVDQLIKAGVEADKAARAVEGLKDALDKTAGAAAAAFSKAFDKLEGFSSERGMSSFDRERVKLKEFVDEARKLSNSKEDAVKVFRAYQDGLDAIAKKETEAEARKSGRGKKSAYEREVDAIRKKAAALRIEADTFGMTEVEAKRYEITQNLLRAARESNVRITPALVDSIRQEADAYVQAESKVRTLAEAKQRANDITKGLSQTFYGAVRGASSLSDAVKRLSDSIADAALQAALMGEGPLASLFGLKTSDGSQGGLFGALFSGFGSAGAASGGPASTPDIAGSIGSTISGVVSGISGLFGFKDGGDFTVGGTGGSDSQVVAFRATPGENVSVRTPGDSGGTTVQIFQTNDFRGVVASERAYYAAQLQRQKKETIEASVNAVAKMHRQSPSYSGRN